MLGLQDYQAAALHLEQAVTLSQNFDDKGDFADALEYKAENHEYRGEVIVALETINEALKPPRI
jgi:hypothetical protein